MSDRVFSISQRHYDILLQQVTVNLPQEAGGFLGGKDDNILAVLPMFNQHLFNKTDTFGLVSDDFIRAHTFFKKHKLDYFGVYHSHPKGVAYPSKADLMTGQKYHFIFGLEDPENPTFSAFEVIKGKPYHIPIRIVANNAFQVIDIYSMEPTKSGEPMTLKDVAQELSDQVQNIQYRKAKYKRMDPKSGYDASDFSTFA